jgi:hypothetical protein
LRNGIALIEKGKLDSFRVVVYKDQVTILQERLNIKDEIIKEGLGREENQKKIIGSFEKENLNLQNQVGIAKEEMKYQNKLYKRQKRKTVVGMVLTGVVAVVVTKLITN